MTGDLQNRVIVIVGAGSGLGRALAEAATAAGAEVVAAGRRLPVRVDLRDEDTVRALADRVEAVDHVVCAANDPANGPLVGLDARAVADAFAAKVTGPLLLAKHLGPRIRDGGSMLLFSGFLSARPAPGRVVAATANGAVDALVRALAVELAPLRVNAVSPGVVDTGAWDPAVLAAAARRNPVRRAGSPPDIVQAALLALTNPFLTGAILPVDGGARLS